MKGLPDLDNCIGCGVCIEVCPVKCLSFYKDKDGFAQIIGDVDKCIQCNKCERLCPILTNSSDRKHFEQSDIIVYACKHKDPKLQKRSSSGGFFVALCSSLFSVYEDNLTVYGAAMQADFSVQHIAATSFSDISQFVGSKYLQSDISSVLLPIKENLNKGRIVLFSGTPCQIAALKSYLGKEYTALYTCEVICHGVPSYLHFEKQNNYFAQKYDAKVVDIQFRSKFICWTIPTTKYTFSDEKVRYFRMEENSFMNSFYEGLNLRCSCYNCKYSSIPRQADITMGDFWGIGKSSNFSLFAKERGISLVLCNSEKGKTLFQKAQLLLDYELRTIEEAIKGNVHLIRPVENKLLYRKQLLSDLYSFSIEEVMKNFPIRSAKKSLGLLMGHRCLKLYYYIKEILRK